MALLFCAKRWISTVICCLLVCCLLLIPQSLIYQDVGVDNIKSALLIDYIPYDHKYYRFNYYWHKMKCSFWIYRIEIGKLFIGSQNLSLSIINNYTSKIADKILFTPKRFVERMINEEQYIPRLYDLYYNEKKGETWNNIRFYDFMTTTTQSNDPILYSYIISSDNNGNLSSLQFKFGEILSMKQEPMVKHLVLNRGQTQLLWCGEMWIFYDNDSEQYVLVLDNSSGHWSPNIKKLPLFLYKILRYSLFSNFKYFNETYKPILLVGFEQSPWKKYKKQLFPWKRDMYMHFDPFN